MTTAVAPNTESVAARDRILSAIAERPLSLSEIVKVLNRSPKIGSNEKQRKEIARSVINEMLAEKRIYEHPKGGRVRSPKYGTRPADPAQYINKSGLRQLQAVYERLARVGVPREEIVAAACRKLNPPVEMDGNRCKVDGQLAARHEGWLEAIIEFLREFEAKHPLQTCSFTELYEQVAKPRNVSVGEFHEGLRRLSGEGRLELLPWTQPLFSLRDDRLAMIAGKQVRFYARLCK